MEAKKLSKKKSARDLIAEAADASPPRATSSREYRFRTGRVKKAFQKADVGEASKGDTLAVKPADFLRHQFPTAAVLAARRH